MITLPRVVSAGAAPIQAQYQVFFMKKLWLNIIPGKDLVADQIFYYHQELPKYIRGYHKCTKQDAIKLAAVILRVRYNAQSQQALMSITNDLKEIVPFDLIKAQSQSEWKKNISSAYSADGRMTVEEAKNKFLQIIYQWPTYGSTFFEVKQSSEPTFPEVVIIAINKNGVNVIHPQTKVKLCSNYKIILKNVLCLNVTLLQFMVQIIKIISMYRNQKSIIF